MGAFLDCRVENDFPKLEINEEISKELQKKPKNIRNNINMRHKKNMKLNNITNKTNDEDDMIIINTDEEKSDNNNDKENKRKNNTKNNKDKKINNTIFINNSNVTISQRKEKKLTEELNEIKNDFNCYNSNDDNIELNEILNNVFNNNKVNSISYNNRNLFAETDIDYNYNKEYFDQLYTEQSQIKLDINPRNENDEKIIKKLNKLKEKINNKNKPKEKNKKYKYKFEFNPVKVHRTISMTNKQIKKNIPSYRKDRGFFNSISFNKNHHFRRFKDYSYSQVGLSNNLLGNSFNKSLYSSLMFESVKENFYNTQSNNLSNNINEDLYLRNSRKTPSIYSMQKSYFNNSSINQTSSGGINSQIKNSKQKSLYKVISKKMRNKSKSKTSQKKSQKTKENLIKFDLKKEMEKDENNNKNLLYHQYRDIIEIILPNNFNEESIVNNKIYDIFDSNRNKAILNYNKINKFKASTILYDGILYKVTDKKNNGFKLSKRYFQIMKNCFRYYYSLEKQEKPLVQFDIRHIKDLQIIENDFLLEYKIDNRDIEMVFCIYLNQNNDFFVFAVNNENFGKSVFDILNLLKHYYEDKK